MSNIQMFRFNKKYSNLELPEFFIVILKIQKMEIGKGDQAMMACWQLINDELPADEVEKTKTALLEYCRLDTLAMVKIFVKLAEMIYFFEQNMMREGLKPTTY